MRSRAWIIALLLLLLPTAAFALATIRVEPGSVGFAARCVRTRAADVPITITNDGNRDATDVKVRISPSPMASIFPLSGATAIPTLGEDDHESFGVGFVPGRAGRHEARARIEYTTRDEPTASGSPTPSPVIKTTSIPLSGEGIDRFIDASPRALNFGDHRLGVAAPPQTVQVFDDGGSPLQITGISIGGDDAGDFTVSPRGSTTITESSPLTLTVRFTPRGVGARTARLRINSNACKDPLVQVDLIGVGVTQDIVAVPGELDFGGLEPGRRRTERLTVGNQGGAPLRVLAVRMGGTDASAFKILGLPSLPRTLAPGTSFDFRVRFFSREDPDPPIGPAAPGDVQRTARIRVNSNDGDTPSLGISMVGTVSMVQPTVTPTPTLTPTLTPTPSPTPTGPPGRGLGDFAAEAGVAVLVGGAFALLAVARRVRGVPD